jgi:hypothetical protein
MELEITSDVARKILREIVRMGHGDKRVSIQSNGELSY